MTDQTRWGIPELHLKNKIKKYQDDNYRVAKEHASRLTDQNKQKLIEELQKGMQKDHGSVQNDSKKPGVGWGVGWVSVRCRLVSVPGQLCRRIKFKLWQLPQFCHNVPTLRHHTDTIPTPQPTPRKAIYTNGYRSFLLPTDTKS